ncbi:hypothetical protein DXG01_004838, partial [Tephrocybe rancida]
PGTRSQSMASTSLMDLPPIPHNVAAIAGPPCFPEDRRKFKVLVYGLFILDTLQSVLGTADAFFWLAKGFGNMNMLADPYISPFDQPMLDGIIAFIVQTFFCWRLWVLQKSWWLPVSVFVIVLASFAGAIATCIGGFQLADMNHLNVLKWQLTLWLGGNAITDTLIAVSMTILLLRSQSRDFKYTNNILVRIVRLTVETNTLTASVAIVFLVCLLAIPNNPDIAVAPAYVLGKLYSNTLLAVFNNRIYMSSRGIVPRNRDLASTDVDIVVFAPGLESSRDQIASSQGHHGIEMHRDMEVSRDAPLKTFRDGALA